MPALRGSLRQGRLPVGVRRAGVPVPLLVRRVGRHLCRVHAEGLRRRDRPDPDARGRGARRVRRGAGEQQPPPMCRVEVESCYEGREDDLGCVNPEFHELPVGEPSFRIFAQVQAKRLTTPFCWCTSASVRLQTCANFPTRLIAEGGLRPDPEGMSSYDDLTFPAQRAWSSFVGAIWVASGPWPSGPGTSRIAAVPGPRVPRKTPSSSPGSLADVVVAVEVRAQRGLRVVHVQRAKPVESELAVESSSTASSAASSVTS